MKIQNHRFHEFAPIPTKDIQEDKFETVKDHEGVKVDQLPQPSKSQFEETNEVSDIALVVEGRELHVSKSVLMLHSPVFKTMFTADFKENNLKEIPLEERKYAVMVNLLDQSYLGEGTELIRGEFCDE